LTGAPEGQRLVLRGHGAYVISSGHGYNDPYLTALSLCLATYGNPARYKREDLRPRQELDTGDKEGK